MMAAQAVNAMLLAVSLDALEESELLFSTVPTQAGE